MSEQPLIVNVVSVSYSGSTWLNLMLGSHSEAFSVGKVTSLRRRGHALCRVHGEQCPVWSKFNLQSDQNLYQQMQHVCGKRILVVNNPRQFEPPQKHSGFTRKHILLVRDGRAVVASQLRKFPEDSVWKAAWHWRKSFRKNVRRLWWHRPEDRAIVRYEQMLSQPEAEMQRVCNFLGIGFEPAMVRYWEQEHCFLGGNAGTLKTMASKQQKAIPDVRGSRGAKFDSGFYQNSDAERFVDERWKRELTPHQLRIFNVIGGRLNARYGYEPVRIEDAG